MIPIGYLYKFVAPRPAWLKASSVVDICCLSNCVSGAFTDFIRFWKHNGYWLFDSPEIMEQIASEEGIDISKASLFYYEAYGEEFDEDMGVWRKFEPEASFVTNVDEPRVKESLGYDVVTFSVGTAPECSPLSCNSVAEKMPVNKHCLFVSFDEAKKSIESGTFANTEPGPHRIVAVYAISRADLSRNLSGCSSAPRRFTAPQ